MFGDSTGEVTVQRRALLAAMAATGVTRVAPIMASAQTDTGTATATRRGVDVTQTYPITGYAPINGLQIYYEIHGSGDTPLLLLHGGIVGSVTFAPLLPGLSVNRQVITIDLQGHGHTRDIDRPLREEPMADDVAGVLAHLEIEQADLLGYSMGGGVALQTAFRHPEIVRKLIIVSATMRRDGSYPEVVAQLDQLEANAPQLGAQVAQSPLATVYPEADWGRSSPRRARWQAGTTTGQRMSPPSRPQRCSSSPMPTRSAPSTWSSSTNSSAAANATPAWTAPFARRLV